MLALSPGLLLASLATGVATGAIAGLLPGVHVNNTSAILLGFAPALTAAGVPAPYIAIAIVASTVAQSFFDIVPSIFLGAPDDATVLAVMPGHRMLLDGRGIEAVRLAAAGSGLAIVASAVLILPLSVLFLVAYPYMWGYMALILAAISAFIVLSNRADAVFPDTPGRIRKICHGLLIYAAAGFLGILAFAVEPALVPVVNVAAPTVLLPLLSGLFGAPVLLLSLEAGTAIPRQIGTGLRLPAAEIGRAAAAGAVAGAMVAWFPAVSSGVATAITGVFARRDHDADRRYLIAVSGVNASNAVFSLIALYVIGRPRSGAVAAAQELLGGTIGFGTLALFLAAIGVTAAVSYPLTLIVGGYAADLFARIDYRWLNRGVLAFLVVMCLLMSGAAGVAVFLMAAAVGMAAHLLNVRKTCLMGVLLLPCILYFL